MMMLQACALPWCCCIVNLNNSFSCISCCFLQWVVLVFAAAFVVVGVFAFLVSLQFVAVFAFAAAFVVVPVVLGFRVFLQFVAVFVVVVVVLGFLVFLQFVAVFVAVVGHGGVCK